MNEKLDGIFIRHFERELKEAENTVKVCKILLRKLRKSKGRDTA